MIQKDPFGKSEEVKNISVDFLIRSDNLDPVKITQEFQIQPTRSWAKGDKHLGKKLDLKTREIVDAWYTRPWGIWGINSDNEVHTLKVEDHIIYLINLLEPKSELLNHYIFQREKYIVRFNILYHSFGGHGGYFISSELLKRLGQLCQYIEFRHICTEDKEVV
jgi:hypothetical protein